MTKKLLSILLCVTMILTSFVTISFADSTTASLAFQQVEISGDTVKLPVVLTGNTGLDKISSLTMDYSYDNTKLTYEGIEDGRMTFSAATCTDGKISWVAGMDGAGAAIDSANLAGVPLFKIVFKKVSGATGVTDVAISANAEITSDSETKTLVSGNDNRISVELTPAEITFGAADKKADGEIHIPVSISTIPADIAIMSAFTLEYTYDKSKLEYVKTNDGLLTAAGAEGGDYAVDGKISFVSKGNGLGVAGAPLFTLVFKAKDATFSGTTEVKPTFAEIGNKSEDSRKDLILKGTTVELTPSAIDEPKLDSISASVASFDIPWTTFNGGEDAVKAYVKNMTYTITAKMTDNSTKEVTASAEVVVNMTAKTVKFSYTEDEITKETAALTLNIGEAPLAKIEVVPATIDIPFVDYNKGSVSVDAFIAGKYVVNAILADGTVINGVQGATAAVRIEQKEVYVSYAKDGETKTEVITLNVGEPQLTKIVAKKSGTVVESIDYCVADVAKIKTYIEAQGIKVYGVYEDNAEREVDAVLAVDTANKAVYTFDGKTAEIAINIVGHDWVSQSRTEPTDTEDGFEIFKCSRCDEEDPVKLPKLTAEVEEVIVEPTTVDVPYSAWNDANAAEKIKAVIKSNVSLKAKMTDGTEYSNLINEATIAVDTAAKKATVSYGGKDAELTLNFEPDPTAATESVTATPSSITLAYADWYGKTAEQLADFVKAYAGFKVTATKADGTTVDVTDDAVVTVTVGSNLTGTATVTYDGKETAIALAFMASSGSGSSNRRPGGGGSSIFIPVTPTPSNDSVFKDLTKDNFAYDAIAALYKRGVVSGDGNNYIYPENGITREEIAKIALAVNQIAVETGLEMDAADKDSVSPWATNIVATAMKKGILGGYEDGTIRPNRFVTREEMVAVFVRALGVQADSKDTKFGDVSSDAWSAAYIAAASDLGFVNGYEDGTFRPANNITRAEAFVICYRIMQFRDTLTAAIAG